MYVGCVDWGEKRAMWLEIGMGVLLVLALVQCAVLLQATA